MAKGDKTAHDILCAAITAMSYGELLKLGDQLADIKLSRLETREDFAKLLHTWAESQ
jgi:hypothetical protein